MPVVGALRSYGVRGMESIGDYWSLRRAEQETQGEGETLPVKPSWASLFDEGWDATAVQGFLLERPDVVEG